MDGTFYECCQHTFILRKIEQKNKVEEIYVSLFWKKNHINYWSHTSTSTLYFYYMKHILALQHLNHIKF
jgi:hypothetical protein